MPITASVRLSYSKSATAAGAIGDGDAAAAVSRIKLWVSRMRVDPEVSTLLSAPLLGGAARALCGALQAPDVHSATLRDALEAFVREAQAQALSLAEVRHSLGLMVRDCARAPEHDRAGVTEYVLRRAAVLYESSFSTL